MKAILIVSILLTLIINILLLIFLKNRTFIKYTINILAAILLIWKISEFSYYAINGSKIVPVEFSHIAYFIVGIFVLTQYKRLYFTAGIYSFISSVGYIITACISPATVIANHSNLIIIAGLLSHSILLIIGSLILFTYYKFDWVDFLISIFVLLINYIYLILIKYNLIFKNYTNLNSYFSIKLIKGEILEYLGVKIDNSIIKNIISASSYFIFTGLIVCLKLLNNYINSLKLKS